MIIFKKNKLYIIIYLFNFNFNFILFKINKWEHVSQIK